MTRVVCGLMINTDATVTDPAKTTFAPCIVRFGHTGPHKIDDGEGNAVLPKGSPPESEEGA